MRAKVRRTTFAFAEIRPLPLVPSCVLSAECIYLPIFISAATSKKQNTRSGGGGGVGGTKKSGGGSSGAGAEGDKKKSRVISKAVQKKIDSWWEENADALVKKAVEKYDWKEDRAKDTVKAYEHFFIVKREMKDWENKLIPCDSVATMMEQHELNDGFDYRSDMKLLCGHDFGGKLMVDTPYTTKYEDFVRREKVTFEAVARRFDSDFNEKLWNTLSINIVEVDGGLKLPIVEWGFTVNVQNSDPLGLAFEVYAQTDPAESLSELQFLLLRTQAIIDPTSETAAGLGLIYTDVILGLSKSEALIEVKKKGAPRLLFAAERKKTIATKLKDLVKDDEEDESEYVFVFKGKRLFGYETPMSLQMKHFDIIDAIPAKEYAKDYKCPRCICCQNTDHDVEG